MRVVAGGALMAHGLGVIETRPGTSIVSAVEIVNGILLVAGLWTPIAGSLAAIVGLWNTISQPGDHWACIFLGTIGAALALVGPGAWSLDARIFGWKRIDVRDRKR